ncbi:hypothetical protein C7K25_10980 [Gulosibacter molinativorax]|uniref:Uncharacterized protein n=1 Tax=Gulosibacter molinativorax TaxID=256821 RepID=A0ABT7C9R0_9MICO|nr:hypothetical protein [Gulosibacter molinativorax]
MSELPALHPIGGWKWLTQQVVTVLRKFVLEISEKCVGKLEFSDTMQGCQEVADVKKRLVDKEAVRRAALRSTRASASLERRDVPVTFVRSEKTERYLAERRRLG